MLILNRIDISSVPTHCATLPPILESTECPGSEWEAVLNWILSVAASLPDQLAHKVHVPQAPYSTQVRGKTAIRQLLVEASNEYIATTNASSGQVTTHPLTYSLATTQPVVIADALVNTAALWTNAIQNAKPARGHGSALHDDQDAVHNIVGYYQPYVQTLCAFDTIEGANDQNSVFFPLPDHDSGSANVTNYMLGTGVYAVPAVEYSLLKKAQLLDLPGSALQNRFKWVEIPASFNLTQSNVTSAGLIVLQPQREATSLDSYTRYNILTCRIDAGWGKSLMNTTTTQETNTAVSSLPDADSFSDSLLSRDEYNKVIRANHNPSTSIYEANIANPVAWAVGQFPQIPIRMTPQWAEFLNPFVPSINDTVLNFLFSIVEQDDTEFDIKQFAQSMISSLVANALGRVGFNNVFEGNLKTIQVNDASEFGRNYTDVDGTAWIYAKEDFFYLSPEDENKGWAKFQVKSTIKGYAYNTNGFAPKVAISFLLTYCAIALTHTFYSGITGIQFWPCHHLLP